MKQKLIEPMNKSAVKVWDFNPSLSNSQKISKDIELNNTMKELSLTFTNIPPNRIIHSFHVCMEMHHKRADTGS